MLPFYEHYPALSQVPIKTGHVALEHDPTSTPFISLYIVTSSFVGAKVFLSFYFQPNHVFEAYSCFRAWCMAQP